MIENFYSPYGQGKMKLSDQMIFFDARDRRLPDLLAAHLPLSRIARSWPTRQACPHCRWRRVKAFEVRGRHPSGIPRRISDQRQAMVSGLLQVPIGPP